jgi:hypothetical protein
MSDQSRSDYPVSVPALVEVFSEIARKRDWAPDLPAKYFQLDVPPTVDQQSVGGLSALTGTTGSLTSSSGGSGGTGSGGGSSGGSSGQIAQRPVHNNNPEPEYDGFAVLGLKTAKVKEHCESKQVPWPMVSRGVKFCASYHIKHMCNTRCGAAGDHKRHNAEETQRMVEWCNENYKVE